MPAKTHVHQYLRAVGMLRNKDSGFKNYYKCADPDCSHYLRTDLVLGKRSICNRCGKEFVLPAAQRMLKLKPHCKACTKKKE